MAIYSILLTFLTFVIALPVAFYITKVVAPKFQGFLLVLLLLPFWVSELVRVYGWMILLHERSGGTIRITDNHGAEKIYHSLDHATEIAKSLGFETVRVEEHF